MELDVIHDKIHDVRGCRVILDRDLARMYCVTTKVLNQAVKRNINRFPEDFMFQLTQQEWDDLMFQNGISSLRSQIVTSNRGGDRYIPYAFTEQGVAMLSGLLKSEEAINANIAIMRAFVAMRNYLTTTATVTAEIAEIRAKIALLERGEEDTLEAVNDLSEDLRKDIENLYVAIGELSVKPTVVEKPRRRIGFNVE